MARIEEIERRLLNWARWKAGGRTGGLGYSSINLVAASAGGGRDGYREATIPTNDCEADETDRAVQALPSELRRTVEVVYLDGGGIAHKARRLCCAESTLHSRIDQAHRKLSAWLADVDALRRKQRALNERLQASARP